MIGVLGGMGPAATLDFLAKLVRLTPAERDQDHVPVVVLSDPRISDRSWKAAASPLGRPASMPRSPARPCSGGTRSTVGRRVIRPA